MRTLWLLAALMIGATPARAVDGIAVQIGSSSSSNASVDVTRVGVQWNWGKRWALGDNWHIGGFWDVAFGHWSNSSPQRTNSSLTEVALTPTFRLEQTRPGAVTAYLEAAIGFHLLSESSVSRERRFGTMFQFGDHVGFGIRFGPKRAMDLGYRYQHLSNASIKQPNQGINFHLVRFQYHF